jgi:hypothetical protein
MRKPGRHVSHGWEGPIIAGRERVAVRAFWTIPLTLFVLLAGCFPSRRALFGEAWGFADYLAHLARFWLAE